MKKILRKFVAKIYLFLAEETKKEGINDFLEDVEKIDDAMVERNLAYLERLKNGAPSKGNPARIHEREVYFKYKKDYLRRKSISHH